MKHDASESRYLRKKHANEGLDEQQEQEQKQFGQNLEKALDTFGKKGKKKDIQSQVQYFGSMIEPFNMRQEQQMGDIDQEGYFVFKRRGEYRDAWLDSIEEGNDMMVADKVKKKIKTEGVTFKGLYDEDKQGDNPDDQKINEANEDEENDDNEENENIDMQDGKNKDEEAQESQNGMNLEPNQIKQLLCQLLPMNKSANAYVKQLKKKIKDPETKDLHDKILELCNMYIEKTNEYDILTSKKQQLQAEVGIEDQEKSEEVNWDDDGDEDEQKSNKKVQNMQMKQEMPNKKAQNKGNKNKENKKYSNIKMNTNNQVKQDNYSDDDIF